MERRSGCAWPAQGLRVFLTSAALCALAGPVAAQQDPWRTLAPMPTPRRLLAAAAEGGQIYTFGGCGSPCFEPPVHTSTFEETRLEVYDAERGAWSVRNPIPAILFGAAAAASNRRIYVFGGFVTGNAALEYDPEADTWSPRAPMPTSRHGLAAVTLNGEIYALGGSNGSAASNAVEAYNPVSDTWSRKAPMPTALVFLGAAAIGGRIYAIGGAPDCCGNSRTDVVEIYDPATDSWSRGAALPTALQVSAVAAANGKVFVFGGFIPGSGAQSSTFEYNPITDAWTAREPLPVARDQAPAVAASDGIHVLGGSVDCHCRALGDHHSYTPDQEPPEPVVSISKDDDRNRVAPGDNPLYRITVRNDSLVAVSATVDDRLTASGLENVRWCRGASCTPSTPGDLAESIQLPSGGTAVYRATGMVPCACRIPAIRNTACVTPAGRRAVCDSDVDPIVPADLVLSLTSQNEICENATATYTFTVRNPGPSTARNVVLQIQPQNLALLSISSPCSGLPCTIVEIAPRSEVRVTATFGPAAGLACPAAMGIAASVASCCDPTPTDNSAVSEIRFACDLSITKTDGLTRATAGDPITYTIAAENQGCLPVAGARVTDTFPLQLEGVKWCRGEDCEPVHASNLEDLIGLPVGEREIYRATGTVSLAFSGPLVNTAAVEPPGGEEETVTDVTVIEPLPETEAAVSCEAITGMGVEGGMIVKTFAIRNGGPDVLADNPGPEFEDALPSGLTLVGAVASSGTITILGNSVTWNGSIPAGEEVTVEITAMIDVGTLGSTICNIGTVAFDGDGDGVNDQASCCFSVLPAPPISTLSAPALAALILLLAALAIARLRQKDRTI